jgi:phenylalanyl-tRNA synthetase beta chain
MRVPLSWLKDYVAWEGTAEDLADLLSLSGTEVENILHVGAPADEQNMDLFRIGRVLTKQQHPNADKLSLCTVAVTDGWDGGAPPEGAVRQIVCGAHNFVAGDTVAVALPGSTLENGLKLRKANLRGVSSEGMMLSEQELGFSQESEGIVILPAEWKVGDRLLEHLPVAETVLELEITPNRPDCLSVYGIAREVAAVAGLPLAPPPVEEPPVAGAPAGDDVAVEVRDPDLCPRYGARVIRDVTIGQSPAWMKARLSHAGQRPISNVVDVTNYVMLAVGQPLHAFDRDKIEGRRLIIRRAAPGERITTLDDVERALTPDILVIADAVSPSAIAGVMGSEKSEVDEDTRHVVLEAATFVGPNIMRTSKALALRSEASNRFEKGLDQDYVAQGLAMACRLFHELCGGTVAPGAIDVRVAPVSPAPVRFRPVASDALLGLQVPAAEQAAILRRLGCAVDEGSSAAGEELVFGVTPPSWRADLEREVDVVEEVGRVHGLANVPETLPRRRDAIGMLTPSQRLRRRAREALVAIGLDEVATYAFMPEEPLRALGLPDGDQRLRVVRLANPMSAEQAIMRSTLLPRLLTTVRDNLAQQNYPVTVFEQARVYLAPSEGLAHGGSAAVRPDVSDLSPRGAQPAVEREMLGAVLCGPLEREHWTGGVRLTDFYTLKGIVERLLAELGLRDVVFARSDEPFLHPGKAAEVTIGGRRAGWLGLLRPDVTAAFDLQEHELYAAELDVEVLAAAGGGEEVYEDLVAYPPATMDLAVVLDGGVTADELLALVRRAGGKLLRDASVFDVYEGDQVPAGKRSLAVRLTLRAPDRTLSDKDINGVRGKVIAALERELGASLR